ncbi:MAG: BatA domain-containing protein [Limisphaerales bacterium]
MSFLTPLFLLGGAAIAAPIIFHLIRRTSREKTPFSSLMFLSPSPPRITKRSRLEHLFLLLLRCLVLMLLAAGFARPFMKDGSEAGKNEGPGKRTLILVDTSASMQREGAWENVEEAFNEALGEAGMSDAIAVYQFDQGFKPVITFQRWAGTPNGQRAALAKSEFEKLKPGWGSTRLGAALARAAALLEEQDDEEDNDIPSGLELLSDLQKGSDLSELHSFEWPPDMKLKIRQIETGDGPNAGIQFLPPTPGDAKNTDKDLQKVRVYNATDSEQEQFQVTWMTADGQAYGLPSDVYVPPGQSRVLSLERPEIDTASTRLSLTGDAEKFDNTTWLIPPTPGIVNVDFLGTVPSDDLKSPYFFMQVVLQDTRDHAFKLRQYSPGQLFEPNDFLIVCDALPNDSIAIVRKFVETGGHVLMAPRDVNAMISMFQVFKAAPVGIEEVVPPRYALFGEVQFQHPLFTPFADPRFSDFSKIHFWRYRKFPAESLNGSEVLARFDNDDPALVQVPLGKGLAYVMAANWYPTDSQLGLSTKFVPLVFTMMELSGTLSRTPQQHLVGSKVALPFGKNAGGVSVELPDGNDVTVNAGATSFDKTDLPGLYTMNSGTNKVRFAVNVDPRESRTDAFAQEELEQLGVVLGNNTSEEMLTAEEKRQLKNAELENKQKLWRWLIVGALVLLSLEILIAGRLGRPAATPVPA